MELKFNLEKDTVTVSSEYEIFDILQKFPKEVIFEYINDNYDTLDIIDYFNIDSSDLNCKDEINEEEDFFDRLETSDLYDVLPKTKGNVDEYLDFVKDRFGSSSIFDYYLNDGGLEDLPKKDKKKIILSMFEFHRYDLDGLLSEIKDLYERIV